MGKKETPEPQPLVQVPSPPSLSSSISDYVANYPKLVDLEKQYSPQLAQLDFDLLKQFGPQLTDYSVAEQQRLTPNTYGLQESLAKIAADGMGAGLPDQLRNSYLDNLRSEIGPNAGSGIGADYVSTNLLRLGEDYKSYYQNLGLSLLNRMPITQPSSPSFRNPVGNFGLGDASQLGMQGYSAYTNALSNQPFYQRQAGKGGMSSMFGGAGMGALMGLALAAPTGGLSIPAGMALGAGAGGIAGGGGFF